MGPTTESRDDTLDGPRSVSSGAAGVSP
jgi:hypothetical protein